MINDLTILFAFALVALILAGIAVAQSRLVSILAWSCVAGFLGLVLYAWPN
jgi:hypothetical protein